MIISNQKNAIDIKIRESIITKVLTVKFIGVTLDENPTFNDHVKNVTTEISKSVGVMRRLHYQLPADVMVKLYYSLVYSYLTNANSGMGKIGTYTNAERLRVLTGEHENYSQIITSGSSLFTQIMIPLLY